MSEQGVPVPILAAAITVVGAFAVAALVHFLSKRREVQGRAAAACSAFRGEIESVVSRVPPATEHWDHDSLASLSTICSEISVAAAKLAPFLEANTRTKLLTEVETLKLHCEENLPKALSPAEIIYGGGQIVAETVKRQFHDHVRTILSYAQNI